MHRFKAQRPQHRTNSPWPPAPRTSMRQPNRVFRNFDWHAACMTRGREAMQIVTEGSLGFRLQQQCCDVWSESNRLQARSTASRLHGGTKAREDHFVARWLP